MKKFLLGLSAFAMLFATSCQEELDVPMEDKATVAFKVSTPEIASRAYSDGTTATVLQYAVYDADGKELTDLTVTDGTINTSTTVNLQLTTGNTYSVIFWAAAPNAPYAVDFATKTMTVDYSAAVSNDENRDAFYKYYTFTVKGAQTETIELRRPFAQLNIGTADYDASTSAGYTPTQSAVTVKNIYNTINLATGAVENSVEVAYDLADIKKDETFPVSGYEYLAMNYLLVDAEKEVVDVEFTYTDGSNAKTRKVGSVPVQRNYRTNIYGNLLTSQVDINVEIKPEYETPDYDINGFYYDKDTQTYHIYNAEGLKKLLTLTEEVRNGFEGKTILLENNIDLTNVKTMGSSFAPIGSTGERDSRNRLVCEAFKGTFDGGGHTISNLYQSGWDMGYEWGQYGSLGLFAELENATVKNVVIETMDACVEGGDISFIAGSATGDCVFENITIKNSSIGTYNNGCGGIIGWSGAGTYTFKNITLQSDVALGGLWGSFDSSIGGIVGQAEPGATYNFENVTINCRIDAYNDCTASYDYYNYRMCGMVIGRCEETTTIDGSNYPDLSKYNLSFNNVTVNYGDWMNYHYCRVSGQRAVRVEAGYAYDGIATDRDHSKDDVHCMECIPFDQLIGGDQFGVKGLREVAGIKVTYPLSYEAMTEKVADATGLKSALESGKNAILTADVDYGTTQLAVVGSKIDLNGHTLTTNMSYGGIALKEGACIKNGVIEHKSTVAAIKAFNVGSIEDVTIKATCQTTNKTITAIAVQQGGYVGTIKNVTIEGVSQGIEVGYQATIDLIDNANVVEHTNGSANGIGLVINGGKVGKAKNCSFKGDVYGVVMHLKGVFAVGLELENCQVEGGTAAINAYDEKGISNTSGSLVLTYDAATTLIGNLVWDFEEECKSVVTLNRP